MKIRIITTPPGFAPEELRKQWVDTEIPIIGKEDSLNPIWNRSSIENLGGYQVSPRDAINALKTLNRKEAAMFWEDYSHAINFTFHIDVCQLLNDDGSPV